MLYNLRLTIVYCLFNIDKCGGSETPNRVPQQCVSDDEGNWLMIRAAVWAQFRQTEQDAPNNEEGVDENPTTSNIKGVEPPQPRKLRHRQSRHCTKSLSSPHSTTPASRGRPRWVFHRERL
eukprot:m.13384 g.13384  ORF g.13384 m.13384 type:complete len:121 (+) comp9701_c0_seq1:72-434(+)